MLSKLSKIFVKNSDLSDEISFGNNRGAAKLHTFKKLQLLGRMHYAILFLYDHLTNFMRIHIALRSPKPGCGGGGGVLASSSRTESDRS